MTQPKIIGLTGSIGMGKSTVAAMFAEAGIPVFDADAEVRAMQGPGGELIPAIEAAFPGSTGPEGVDRDRLGHQVFADKSALARLEAIVHPAVGARRAAFLEAHHDKRAVVFDIPLLFVNGEWDEYTSAADARQFAQHVRHCSFQSVQQAGHFLDMEHKAAWLQTRNSLLAFLSPSHNSLIHTFHQHQAHALAG